MVANLKERECMMDDREAEMVAFDLAAQGDKIMMNAMLEMKGLGIDTYGAVLTALIYGVFEPSEELSQEHQAMIHVLMEQFIEERTRILDGDVQAGYSIEN